MVTEVVMTVWIRVPITRAKVQSFAMTHNSANVAASTKQCSERLHDRFDSVSFRGTTESNLCAPTVREFGKR